MATAKDGVDETDEVMSAAELKPLLHLAKHKPLNCAIGMTKDKMGVILLDKLARPRKLMAELLTHNKGVRLQLDPGSIRFGRVSVEGGSDSITVHFTVNKLSADTLRLKILEKLRPAGFQHCKITIDSELEDEDGEEDKEAEAAPSHGQPVVTGGDDWQAKLHAGLAKLVKQMAAATEEGSPTRHVLIPLADKANEAIKAGDLNEAVAAMAALQHALHAASDNVNET